MSFANRSYQPSSGLHLEYPTIPILSREEFQVVTGTSHRTATREEPTVARMLRVVSFAETIHAITPSDEGGTDIESFAKAVESLAELGIARRVVHLLPGNTPEQLAEIADAVLTAIEDSPVPDAEWGPVNELLDDKLPGLVGVSASSLVRYRSGTRATPDAVAARLHTLTQIVSDLSGSYNSFGIRRWFTRPRQALDGRAPKDLLSGDWTPDDPGVLQVRQLANTLVGAGIG